jgi:hypothetical protein
LLELASESDLLVFGECHGTQEVPRLILGLLDELSTRGYRGIALEIPHDQRQQLADWATGAADEPPALFGPAEFRCGRGNVQVLSLLQQALSPRVGWDVLCFDMGPDQPFADWTGRDACMAQSLVQQWRAFGLDKRLLAVCGNLHSRLARTPGFEDCWPPFAFNVQQLLPTATVLSVDVVFHAGSFFNGEIRPFRPGSAPLQGDAEIRPDDRLGHTLALHLPHATPVTFLRMGDEE